MSEAINQFLKMVKESDNIVFFGGAGVSTESGIPDFRSVDGLYHQTYDYPPETILSHSFYMAKTEEFYRFYRDKMLCLDVKPNVTHEMLAKLEETKGGDYDVVLADDYIIELAIEEGLVQKLDKESLSNFGNINPLYQGQFYDLTDEYTVPYGVGIPLIVYDPKKVDFEIKGYEDLWNEKLKKNVAVIGSHRVMNGIALKTLGESFNVENLDTIQKAGNKMLELAPNIRLISDSNTQDYILSGEVSAAFMYTSQVNQALTANPEPKTVYPEDRNWRKRR